MTGWLLTAPIRAQSISVERLELNVRVEANQQALYVKATYTLFSSSPQDVLEFRLPEAVAPSLDVRRVWNHEGELPWHRRRTERDSPHLLRVVLREPLEPRTRKVLVVSYDLNLKDASVPEEVAAVTSDSARLATTGWYPLPAASGSRLPHIVRLAVRVPKEWKVDAPAELKQFRDGTLLAGYELELLEIKPGELLFRGGRTLP